MKNSVVNKTALEMFFDQHGTNDPNWRPITKSAMENCEFVIDPKLSLVKSFENFEDCMNIKYEEHCIHFKDTEGCEKVEEFMFKCQDFKHNCTEWPKWIVKLPEHCCEGRPPLFDSSMEKKAADYCKKQDIVSNGEKMKCLSNFMVKESKIRVDTTWNYETAKKLLTTNSKNNAKWKTAIEKTVEACQKQVEGLVEIDLISKSFSCFSATCCKVVQGFK
jgi:hypothetical protein